VLDPGEPCDDGNTTSGDGCEADCTLPPCNPIPRETCRRPVESGRARLKLRHEGTGDKDLLTWKWSKGAATPKADFGDPVNTDDYVLCLYAGGALQMSAEIPKGGTCAGNACWASTGSGYKYKDAELTPDGISKVLLKGSERPGSAKIQVKGKGAALDLPAPASLASPVRVQLSNGPTCWEAVFSAPFKTQDTTELADVAD
jgi:cysteine-rich repeat protein